MKKVTVHGKSWELFRLTHSLQGHKMRSDGKTEPAPIYYVLRVGNNLLESNGDGDLCAFGTVVSDQGMPVLSKLGYQEVW